MINGEVMPGLHNDSGFTGREQTSNVLKWLKYRRGEDIWGTIYVIQKKNVENTNKKQNVNRKERNISEYHIWLQLKIF